MKISDRDALLVIDAQPTFMPGGGLPVTDGDQVVPVIQRLMPLVPRERRIATKDRHPRGHISLASSYVGIDPFTELTPGGALRRAHPMLLGSVQPDDRAFDEGLRILFEAKSAKGKRPTPMNILAPHAKFTFDDLMLYLLDVDKQTLWPDHGIAGTVEAELHPALPEADFGFVLVKGTDAKCDSYSAFRDNLKRPTELADVLRDRGVERVFLGGLAFDYCDGWSALDGVDLGFEVAVVEDATRPVGFPEGSVERMREALKAKGVLDVDSKDLLW